MHMNWEKNYLLIVILLCFVGGSNLVYCQDELSRDFPESQYIRVPPGGVAKFDLQKFCSFLSNTPYFYRTFSDNLQFEATLEALKNGKTDFYPLFMKQKEILAKMTDKEETLQPEKLRNLYYILWLYQDRTQHEKLQEYLDGLDWPEKVRTIFFIINFFGSDYFSAEMYPFFEKLVTELCNENGPFWGDVFFLREIMRASSTIFTDSKLSDLSEIAVERIVKSELKNPKLYCNYMVMLSDYAGRKSMPYFREFFENECCASTLVAISGYFRRNLSTLEFDSMMRRKAYLLQESQTAINELLNPQVQKSEGISQVPAE